VPDSVLIDGLHVKLPGSHMAFSQEMSPGS
jgi:hypothetical protein